MSNQHLTLDALCQRHLDSQVVVESFVQTLAAGLDLTLRDLRSFTFSNGSTFGPGITTVGVLTESSIVVHTAPERGMLNLDVFSCKPFDAAWVKSTLNLSFSVRRVLLNRVVTRH